jgi:hypothetical protein
MITLSHEGAFTPAARAHPPTTVFLALCWWKQTVEMQLPRSVLPSPVLATAFQGVANPRKVLRVPVFCVQPYIDPTMFFVARVTGIAAQVGELVLPRDCRN